jgi:hypothetical protein
VIPIFFKSKRGEEMKYEVIESDNNVYTDKISEINTLLKQLLEDMYDILTSMSNINLTEINSVYRSYNEILSYIKNKNSYGINFESVVLKHFNCKNEMISRFKYILLIAVALQYNEMIGAKNPYQDTGFLSHIDNNLKLMEEEGKYYVQKSNGKKLPLKSMNSYRKLILLSHVKGDEALKYQLVAELDQSLNYFCLNGLTGKIKRTMFLIRRNVFNLNR